MLFFRTLDDRPSISFFFAFQGLVRAVARRLVPIPQGHVPLVRGLVHLLPRQVRFGDQQPGHTHSRDTQQHHLHETLSWIQLLCRIDGSGLQEHGNQHVQKRRRRYGRLGPIHSPLVQDAQHEVAEDRLQEEHLWNEVGVQVRLSLESDVIRHLEAKGESHL